MASGRWQRILRNGLGQATRAYAPRRKRQQWVAYELLGSQEFVDRMRDRLQQPHHIDDVPKARRLCSLEPVLVVAATAEHYGVHPDAFRRRRSSVADRDLAAWLATQLTSATQRELAPYFGRTHPDSIRNLNYPNIHNDTGRVF